MHHSDLRSVDHVIGERQVTCNGKDRISYHTQILVHGLFSPVGKINFCTPPPPIEYRLRVNIQKDFLLNYDPLLNFEHAVEF